MPNVAKYCLAAFLIIIGVVYALQGGTTGIIIGIVGCIAGLAILFGK